MKTAWGVLGVFGLIALGQVACEAGTGGRRATFGLEAAPQPEASAPFDTTAGWKVTFEEACLSFGPVYLYEQAAFAFHRKPREVLDWLVPTAHAHPGVDHFNGGQVRGEWTEQRAVDLLAPAISLGAHHGIAGSVRSFTVGLNPPQPSTDTSCLRGHHAYVVGQATRVGAEIAFEGGIDIDATGTKRRMQVSADVEIDDDRTFVISIDPRAWLASAQFDTLPEAAPGARRVIERGSQVYNAWSLGLQSAGAISIKTKP